MSNYYFLVPSLPDLLLRHIPDITFDELKSRLKMNLHPKDLVLVNTLLRFIDICNIRYLFMEETIDTRGLLSEKELDEALLLKDGFPDYVFDFLDRFDKTHDRIRYFSALLSSFFNEEIPKATGFLKRYFQFEREWRWVMVGLRAKQMGRDLVSEVQFEDFTDPIVAHILAQKDSDRYEPPVEYTALKGLMDSTYPDPLEEYLAFADYRLEKITAMIEGHPFSIDEILSYMARLIIVEQYNELSEDKGRMILETFTQG